MPEVREITSISSEVSAEDCRQDKGQAFASSSFEDLLKKHPVELQQGPLTWHCGTDG